MFLFNAPQMYASVGSSSASFQNSQQEESQDKEETAEEKKDKEKKNNSESNKPPANLTDSSDEENSSDDEDDIIADTANTSDSERSSKPVHITVKSVPALHTREETVPSIKTAHSVLTVVTSRTNVTNKSQEEIQKVSEKNANENKKQVLQNAIEDPTILIGQMTSKNLYINEKLSPQASMQLSLLSVLLFLLGVGIINSSHLRKIYNKALGVSRRSQSQEFTIPYIELQKSNY